MTMTLAFDVYGTLIDTHGMVVLLQEMIGEKAAEFSITWREKQLEYSFRRGLMKNYQSFAVCTRDALVFSAAYHQVKLSERQQQTLLEGYRTLPAFEDVTEGLVRLQQAGFRMFAFSNGTAHAVDSLLIAAGIKQYFVDVISVDDLQTFKPAPEVYNFFLARTGASREQAWLVSSNSFDVIGALSAGMRAVWLQRSETSLLDPWDMTPTLTVSDFRALAMAIEAY